MILGGLLKTTEFQQNRAPEGVSIHYVTDSGPGGKVLHIACLFQYYKEVGES